MSKSILKLLPMAGRYLYTRYLISTPALHCFARQSVKTVQRELLLALFVLFTAVSIVTAASYTDNTYQKLANEYVKQAEKAKRAGDYAAAIELSAKAKENAELSRQFIDMMMSRGAADEQVAMAKERMDWARENNVERRDKAAYEDAKENYDEALSAYSEENYDAAREYASRCLDALADVKARPNLPEYYIVHNWRLSKDCFWNIAKKPFVYNDPFKWEYLYDENKDSIPRTDDPNLVLPDMRVHIPSIAGEVREGVYDPDEEYGTFEEED